MSSALDEMCRGCTALLKRQQRRQHGCTSCLHVPCRCSTGQGGGQRCIARTLYSFVSHTRIGRDPADRSPGLSPGPHTKNNKKKAAKYFQQIPTEKFPPHPARSLVSRLSRATPLPLYHRRQNAANHTRKHRQTRVVVVHNPRNASSCGGTCGVNRPRQPIPHTIHSHLFLPPPPHTPHAAPSQGESAHQRHQCPWHQSKTAGPPGGA